PELRAALQGRLHRGKVEVSVRAALKDERAEVMVAPRPVIAGIVRGLREIQAEHGLEGGVSVADVARFPGALEVLDADTSMDQAATRDVILARVRELSGELGLADDARLYQEVVRLVDRHDVAEELQRLRSHVAQARGLLGGDAPCGKKLDFLVQELAREANTLGSKAVSAPMVQEVVALKTEIERVREQVQNVE